MPVKSAKQMRFMQGIAHGMKPLKSAGAGPNAAVAREFLNKTPKNTKQKFSHALIRKGNSAMQSKTFKKA